MILGFLLLALGLLGLGLAQYGWREHYKLLNTSRHTMTYEVTQGQHTTTKTIYLSACQPWMSTREMEWTNEQRQKIQ